MSWLGKTPFPQFHPNGVESVFRRLLGPRVNRKSSFELLDFSKTRHNYRCSDWTLSNSFTRGADGGKRGGVILSLPSLLPDWNWNISVVTPLASQTKFLGLILIALINLWKAQNDLSIDKNLVIYRWGVCDKHKGRIFVQARFIDFGPTLRPNLIYGGSEVSFGK